MARDVRYPCSIHCADKNTVTPKRTGYQTQETMYIQLIGHDRPCEFNLIQKTVSGNTNMIQCTHARDWHVPPEGVFEGFTIQKVRSQEIHVATFRRTSVAELDNGKTYIRLDNQPTLVFSSWTFLGTSGETRWNKTRWNNVNQQLDQDNSGQKYRRTVSWPFLNRS